MGLTTYYQKSFTKPPQTEVYDNYVAIRSNIHEEVFASETSSITQYTWEEQRLSLGEYIVVLQKEKEHQWDVIEFLLKQTGNIPQEII